MPRQSKKQPAKKSIVKPPPVLPKNAKQRKVATYKSFRLQKRITHPAPRLPSWWTLLKKAFNLLAANKKPIGIFFISYGLLTILLVRGFGSPIDVEGLRDSFNEVLDERTAGLAASFTTFGLLIQSTASGDNQVAQVYQMLLLIIASLAVIWLYRQQQAGHRVTMKQAFYKGMFPFIPFILVLLVMGLQLIPALIGNFLFQSAYSSDLIVGSFELIIWIVLVFLTLLLSFYMLCSSTIALYIVTLPDMTPLLALREARALVRHRRPSILGRIVALLLVSLVLLFVLVVPVIFFAPLVAEWLFFALTIVGIPFIHAYMFSLYRELL